MNDLYNYYVNFILPFEMIKNIVIPVLLIITLILAIRALLKYINFGKSNADPIIKRNLANSLKEYRVNAKMTQEFVAQSLGVSRQAVSKWESGTSDPSTTNLIALAKLYQVSPEEIIRSIEKQ